MRLFRWAATAAVAVTSVCAAAQTTAGIEALVQRRLPNLAGHFTFNLTNTSPPPTAFHTASSTSKPNEVYIVSNGANGTIHITGNSPIALASGLRWYLVNYVHVDIYWYIGSRLHLTPQKLPAVNATYQGSSVVPWRYMFNTVTFSYTAAFWTWEDWELELDWLALRGVNLPLAWVGYEKILSEVFLEAGFTSSDLASFFSGPAFQAWNRFGNIQGSWGGDLPTTWIDSQAALQKQIIARMVELGMTPVLPCFAGFVPMQIGRVFPSASYVNGSQWEGYARQYTNVSFLQPFDPLFATLQKSFISKQTAAYGNVSSIYTLDQYNENTPASANATYLRSISQSTIGALKAADPNGIWMLQGWLFFSSSSFWTNDAVAAYLGGVNNTDMIILDLFSETQPQWQRTNSYYGKPWIWCELHDYGGNMGLYGQVENVTVNPIQALSNKTSTMIGMGLTMEGQEQENEIMYDILLDQAWSSTPLNSSVYFHDWVTSRYHGAASLPAGLYSAWDTMRQTVFNNTQISTTQAVTKSIFELAPNVTGLLNRTGHHPTTITYNTSRLVGAWKSFYGAAAQEPTLWDNPAYVYDLTDITRQVMANAFYPLYSSFVAASNKSANATYSAKTAVQSGQQMASLLTDLDTLLAASGISAFSLASWIAEARSWASASTHLPNSATNLTSSSQIASFYEYNARNQITLWGPTGQISDYASKQWAGLISSYYVPRWQLFVNYTLNGTTSSTGVNTALAMALLAFEESWQTQEWGEAYGESFAAPTPGQFPRTIASIVAAWPSVFS